MQASQGTTMTVHLLLSQCSSAALFDELNAWWTADVIELTTFLQQSKLFPRLRDQNTPAV
jgi:hypothetical protein